MDPHSNIEAYSLPPPLDKPSYKYMALSPISSPKFVERSLTFLDKGGLSSGVMTRIKASCFSEQESKGGSMTNLGKKIMGRITNKE